MIITASPIPAEGEVISVGQVHMPLHTAPHHSLLVGAALIARGWRVLIQFICSHTHPTIHQLTDLV